MEHSKGRLEGNDIFPWDLWIGADKHLFTVHGEREIRIANAERLKKCWNEFDTLKAKAALHDELVAMLKRYRKETPLGNQPHMIAGKADLLIAKAKEIK